MNRILSSFPLPEPDDDDDDEPAIQVDEEKAEAQSIRSEIISDRKKITTEWRQYLLDWLESPLHSEEIHDIEMTISPNGVVIFLVNLDDEGAEQVRFIIDNGHGS